MEREAEIKCQLWLLCILLHFKGLYSYLFDSQQPIY